MMRSKTSLTFAVALTGSALVLAACGGAGGPSSDSGKISNDKVILGLLNDGSGVYKDLSGPNSKIAMELAIEDYKAKHGDKAIIKNIEIVVADHQNKPEIANTKAKEMFERQNVDAILDVPTSSAALAVAAVAKEEKRLLLDVGAGTTELTGKQCNKYTFHWAYNTRMLAQGTGTAIVRNGGKNWSIVYPDYAFGQDMAKSFTEAVKASGGEVQQSIATPFPNDNFATFITKAGSTNPDVIGTMAAGGDLVNFVKQFNQAGMRDKAILAAGLMFITDIHALGVDQFQGTQFTDAWYWDLGEENRKFAERFRAKANTTPSFAHTGNYSATLQYLEAVQEAGTDDADAVVAKLEGKKVNDVFLRNGEIRKADHRVLHDVYLVKVKSPDQVKADWDYEEVLATIPGAEAFGEANPDCTME